MYTSTHTHCTKIVDTGHKIKKGEPLGALSYKTPFLQSFIECTAVWTLLPCPGSTNAQGGNTQGSTNTLDMTSFLLSSSQGVYSGSGSSSLSIPVVPNIPDIPDFRWYHSNFVVRGNPNIFSCTACCSRCCRSTSSSGDRN